MLNKICIHWTAGPYARTSLDYRHYHFTIGKDGSVDRGQFKPEDNIPPLRNGAYAAHCGGGNSNCIGIALRAMVGYKSPDQVGPAPILKVQAEAAWALTALLCRKYGIVVQIDTVFTHYEFGRLHPDSDSAGKIDIMHLPYIPAMPADAIGDYIRQKVRWYLTQSFIRSDLEAMLSC